MKTREVTERAFTHGICGSAHEPVVRPQTADEAVFAFVRGERVGRPRGSESDARVRELLRLLAAGKPPREALREAGVKGERAFALLADPTFRRAVNALLDDRIEAAA